jgi:predicted peroxiredoxin
MDVVENQHYITKWVEDTIINGVKHTSGGRNYGPYRVEDTIQNGVKETHSGCDLLIDDSIEGVIRNGVKETKIGSIYPQKYVEKIMQNRVKKTKTPGADGDIMGAVDFMSDNNTNNLSHLINDVIEHGVKLTNSSLQIDGSCVVEDVIQNGIKEPHDDVYHHKGRVDGVIKNGVKEVKPAYKMIYNPMDFKPVMYEEKRIDDVTGVIRDGIKEVQPLPAQDGNRDWGNYYYRKGDPTKPHTKYVDEVIENGIKETKSINYSDNTELIVNGVLEKGEKI